MAIFVKGRNLPEAWEKSIVELWRKGIDIETEYGDVSRDTAAVILVEKPFLEPRVHLKGIVAGSLKGLLDYVDEVVNGVNDWRVGKDWHYTYHERLFKYSIPFGHVIDQIEAVITKLKERPYTRRAQAITWQPWKDLKSDSPPCLQRLWFRVVDERLVMHAHMRSNDAFKAAFMNMYAFTMLQKKVAEKMGIKTGYYLHVADSYHVYAKDWKWVEKFVKQIETGMSKRYWMSTQDYLRRI